MDHRNRSQKYNLAVKLIKAYISPSAFMVRFIPTSKCNLKCSYCWQNNSSAKEMSKENFEKYINKAVKLGAGMIDFMGGEPLIWPHIYDGIKMCNTNNLLTNITTNGTLLTKENLDNLHKSGLNYLNISIDNVDRNSVSKKTLDDLPYLVDSLHYAKNNTSIIIRVNSVLTKNNFEGTRKLIEVMHNAQIPLSLGFAIPHPGSNNENDIFFSIKDKPVLDEIIKTVINKKRNGYNIIEPESYFVNVYKYLKKEKFWECNYPGRFGWINITPDGRIRTCTKMMKDLDMNFEELDREMLKKLRKILKQETSHCNINCYSNCAYTSWYYKNHKLEFIKSWIIK